MHIIYLYYTNNKVIYKLLVKGYIKVIITGPVPFLGGWGYGLYPFR